MRLWSVHPRYLDRQGLTGGWREALLAQAVLAGRTRGYRSHPQLVRFRAQPDPVAAIGAFLTVLADEATERGYRFDRSRIDRPGDLATHAPEPIGQPAPSGDRIPVTDGQVTYEWRHLMTKLGQRAPERLAGLAGITTPDVHPLFVVVPGPVEDWERLG